MALENAVDAATVGVGIFVAVARQHFANSTNFTADLLNGAMIVPFVVIAASVFSPAARDYLCHTTALNISLAGIVALFFVLRELA